MTTNLRGFSGSFGSSANLRELRGASGSFGELRRAPEKPSLVKVGRQVGGGLGRFKRKEKIVIFLATLTAIFFKPLEGFSLRKLVC